MEAQWIPNNIQKGFLTTATRRYGGDLTHRVWKEINQRTWASNRSRQLGLTGAERPMGKYALSMVDLQNAPAIAPRVVSGTILAIVREDRAFSVTRVSHVGFVIQKDRRTYLRHATRTFGKVVDEDLKTFLARNLKYDKWKVVGISLYDVARVSPSRDGDHFTGPRRFSVSACSSSAARAASSAPAAIRARSRAISSEALAANSSGTRISHHGPAGLVIGSITLPWNCESTGMCAA
jgi:hypothetical protein